MATHLQVRQPDFTFVLIVHRLQLESMAVDAWAVERGGFTIRRWPSFEFVL